MANKITAKDYKKLLNLLEDVAADFDTLEAYDEETTSEEDKRKLAYGSYLYFALHENGYFNDGEEKYGDMPSEEYKAYIEEL
jgi:hypothetical protein